MEDSTADVTEYPVRVRTAIRFIASLFYSQLRGTHATSSLHMCTDFVFFYRIAKNDLIMTLHKMNAASRDARFVLNTVIRQKTPASVT